MKPNLNTSQYNLIIFLAIFASTTGLVIAAWCSVAFLFSVIFI